jgi:hypothetical protein
MVVLVAIISIDEKACHSELKWNILMLPTQIHPAIKL